MLDRKQVLGEDKEGRAWWNRKETKSQVDFTKMQPNPKHVDKPIEKHHNKSQTTDPKEDKPKKKGRSKGKGSK